MLCCVSSEIPKLATDAVLSQVEGGHRGHRVFLSCPHSAADVLVISTGAEKSIGIPIFTPKRSLFSFFLSF